MSHWSLHLSKLLCRRSTLVPARGPPSARSLSMDAIMSIDNKVFLRRTDFLDRKRMRNKRANKKPLFYRGDPALNMARRLNHNFRMILQLKDLLVTAQYHSMSLSDIREAVSSLPRANLLFGMAKSCPRIYKFIGNDSYSDVTFTDEATALVAEETRVRKQLQPYVVQTLRKLLMMASVYKHRMMLRKIKWLQEELRLPHDFEKELIPRYSDIFSIENDDKGEAYLILKKWNSALAVTHREKTRDRREIRFEGHPRSDKFGNFPSPYSFRTSFVHNMKLDVIEQKNMALWQQIPFPSPYSRKRSELRYCDWFQIDKRHVGVIHELLSLTIRKEMCFAKIACLRSDLNLPDRLLTLLDKFPSIFYVYKKDRKPGQYVVFLKEGYQGHEVKNKCPLLLFYDKFLLLRKQNEFTVADNGKDRYLPLPEDDTDILLPDDGRDAEDDSAGFLPDDGEQEEYNDTEEDPSSNGFLPDDGEEEEYDDTEQDPSGNGKEEDRSVFFPDYGKEEDMGVFFPDNSNPRREQWNDNDGF